MLTANAKIVIAIRQWWRIRESGLEGGFRRNNGLAGTSGCIVCNFNLIQWRAIEMRWKGDGKSTESRWCIERLRRETRDQSRRKRVVTASRPDPEAPGIRTVRQAGEVQPCSTMRILLQQEQLSPFDQAKITIRRAMSSQDSRKFFTFLSGQTANRLSYTIHHDQNFFLHFL